MFLKQNCIVFYILFFVCILSNAQNHSNLEGKVVSETMDVSDVHVINSTSKKAAISNAYGYFTISVKLNDTICEGFPVFEGFIGNENRN